MRNREPQHWPMQAPPLPCDRAPEGWYCTRENGHDGPCAAHPEDLEQMGITVTPIRTANAGIMSRLEGATTEGLPNAYAGDAGEFAARWNAHTPEQREYLLQNIQQNSLTAIKCFIGNHDGLRDMLEQRDRALDDLRDEHDISLRALGESRANVGDLEARANDTILDLVALDDWDSWVGSEDARERPQPFTVHVYGPDDVFPARTWREATMAAHAINQALTEYARDVHDPTAFGWATPYPTALAVELGLIGVRP